MKIFSCVNKQVFVEDEDISHVDLVLRQIGASPRARNAIKSWARVCAVGDRHMHLDTEEIWERIA